MRCSTASGNRRVTKIFGLPLLREAALSIDH
jgi:hypothetical protein